MNEGHHMLGICPIYYVYNILLITLQVLHIIWFISILRMVHQYIVKGKVGCHSLIEGSRLVYFTSSLVDTPQFLMCGSHHWLSALLLPEFTFSLYFFQYQFIDQSPLSLLGLCTRNIWQPIKSACLIHLNDF